MSLRTAVRSIEGKPAPPHERPHQRQLNGGQGGRSQTCADLIPRRGGAFVL